jgi:hypothetical protein
MEIIALEIWEGLNNDHVNISHDFHTFDCTEHASFGKVAVSFLFVELH